MTVDPFFEPYSGDYLSKHATGDLLANTKLLGRSVGELLAPDSVLDVGCGVGAALAGIREARPDATLYGIDSPHAYALILSLGLLQAPFEFYAMDLRELADAAFRPETGVTCSFEVGEHLPESVSDRLIHFVTRNTRAVVWSAAVPGAGGEGHLCERPPEWWLEKFRANRFDIDWDKTVELRRRLRAGRNSSWWYDAVSVLLPMKKAPE